MKSGAHGQQDVETLETQDTGSELDRLRVIRNMLHNLIVTDSLILHVEPRYAEKTRQAWVDLQQRVADSMAETVSQGGG